MLLAQLQARRTSPEPQHSSSIWLPAKRGGVVVTQDKALQLSALFACVRVISADIAKLPWNVYAEQGSSRVKLTRSPLYRLLNVRPNPETGAFAFRQTLVAHALTYGNGYAEIERDMAGRPLALWQLSPDRCCPERDESGRLRIKVTNSTGEPSYLDPENVFHLHGLGWDGLQGYSTVAYAAQTIGFGLAAAQHGSAFYGNNAVLGMVLEHPAKLSDVAHKRLKKSLDERKGAGAFQPFITEEGMKVQIPGTKQVDSQYIETRYQLVEEICSIMRVPPSKIMHWKEAHYANAENGDISYGKETLGEWTVRLEEEADYKLISTRSQASYTKLNMNALMRGDSVARVAYYEGMLRSGVYSINDVRALEDEDPIPDGDMHVMQAQMTPLERIKNPPEPKPVPQPAKEADTEADKKPTARAAVAPAITACVERLLAADMKKAKGAKLQSAEGCDGWMDEHFEKDRGRILAAWRDLAPSICLAYQTDADADILTDCFITGSRAYIAAELFGKGMGVEEIADAIKGAL